MSPTIQLFFGKAIIIILLKAVSRCLGYMPQLLCSPKRPQKLSVQMIPRSHLKGAVYRIWCGVNRLGDSGVNRLGDTSAFVIPAGQLLLTRRGKTRMYTVGIVFEFYTVPL